MKDITSWSVGVDGATPSFSGDVFERREPVRSGPAPCVDAFAVEAELAQRALLHLGFPPAIEARYEADTKAERAWHIRLTVPFGLVAYLAFSFVDAALLPDLGSGPVLLRFLLITPVGLFIMWMCSWASAAFREAFISFVITAAMLIAVGLIAVSRADLAPYTIVVVLLSSMFGNITMRLRFPWACAFSTLTIAAVGGLVWLRADLPGGLTGALVIAVVTCVTFGLVANNQLERAERRSFLLTLRERLRSDELRRDKDAFSALSLADSLTGLANRRAFDAELTGLWREWRSERRTFCLVMIDVDYFKRFNDLYGHPQGDVCLVRVAHALKTVIVRQNDMVARYGGEEFAVLISACGRADALKIAERLCREVVEAAIPHGDRDDGVGVVTISAGVASCEGMAPGEGSADLLLAADRSLYAAKSAGRNRAVAATTAAIPAATPDRRTKIATSIAR